MPFLRPLRPQESQIGNQPSPFISGWISRISSALISISLNPFSFSTIFAIFLVFLSISCGRSGSRTRTEPVSGRAGGSCPPWVPKNQKVMKVASLRYCAERGSRTPVPDLPTNALIYRSQGLTTLRMCRSFPAVIKPTCYSDKRITAVEGRRGIEPRQRPYMIAILPVSGRTSQPGLLINVLRESDGLPVLEPGKGITPARAIAEPVLKLNLEPT